MVTPGSTEMFWRQPMRNSGFSQLFWPMPMAMFMAAVAENMWPSRSSISRSKPWPPPASTWASSLSEKYSA